MTADAYVQPEPDGFPFADTVSDSAGLLRENTLEDGGSPDSDDEDDVPTINDVESLRKGIVKTSKNKAQVYTILLVGETGTGKSSLLELIANVLNGKTVDCYDFNLLDHSNEQGGSGGQSQTNSARFYEFTSRNGILVRILDAPGFADTRGIHQDELHKKSIATEIQEHVASVSAVLILANGAIPRITPSTDYAIAVLSALFPKSLANNIAFLFSNASTHLSLNFSQDAIPSVLKESPQFLFDNPIALQRRYLELKDDPGKKRARKETRKVVISAEQKALEMLGSLFDWLDGLEPQPTKAIMALYEKSQSIEAKITNTFAQMDQTAAKMAEINELMKEFQVKSTNMDALSNFEKIMNALVWEQQPHSTRNYLCTTPNCYSTCGMEHSVGRVVSLFPRQLASCSECKHPHLFHYHLYSEWVQVQKTHVSVDDDIKKQWEGAKEEKERTEALVVTCKGALEHLGRNMDESMEELTRLAAEYAALSLSGSFSAHLEKATLLMEQRCKTMEEKGVGVGQLAKMRRSVEEMKGRLDLLSSARGIKKIKETIQEGVQMAKEAQEGVLRVKDDIHEGLSKVWEKVMETVVGEPVEN